MTAPRSLTRTEAEARAGLVEVVRYDLELDLTGLLDGDELRATSRVTFRCREEGAETFADCLADVEEATLNGAPLPTGPVPGGRIPLTDLRAENVLVVRSVQRRTDRTQGVHRSVDAADGEVYVWTCFCPDDTRRVFACFDQPDLKAVFGITVVAPTRWTVTSSSGYAEVTGDGASRTWTYPDTPALSTYVPVVNAGPFHALRSERGGYDLGLYARKSLAGMLERDAEELFELTVRGLAFYGEQFALPFPQRSYDQVFVPDFGGAMENYGCVTLTDLLVFRDEPSEADREMRALVVLHEMAHMWFGDIVTMRWWDDLWLNESFAEWACHWALPRCSEFTDGWAGMLVKGKLAAYAADRAPSTHPIRQPIEDVEAAAASFDAITYPKGAAALRQLVALVGEGAFVRALASHFAEHAWRNTTLLDLVHQLERTTGRDLGGWVETWLGTAGTDRLLVERSGADATIRVEPPAGRGPLLHRLDVGVYVDHGEVLTRVQHHEIELTGGSATLTGVGAEGLLLVNDGDLTFASVRPDPVSLEALLTRGGALPDALGRCLAVTGAWDLLAHGEVAAADLVSCGVRVLAREDAPSVVEPVLGLVVRAADYWSPAGARDDLLAEVADLCLLLADRPGHRLAAARGLAASAVTRTQLDALTGLADTPDLGWRRLTRLAELGRYDPAEAERLLAADPDPEAWVSALTARTARPEPAAKDEAWATVFVDGKVPPVVLAPLGQAFWRPGQDALLTGYASEFLDALPDLGGRGLLMGLALVAGMLPRAGVDPAYVDRLVDAAGAPGVSDLVRQRVVEGADGLRRMLASRA